MQPVTCQFTWGCLLLHGYLPTRKKGGGPSKLREPAATPAGAMATAQVSHLRHYCGESSPAAPLAAGAAASIAPAV